jgi:DNA excision repair protein ERCC-8
MTTSRLDRQLGLLRPDVFARQEAISLVNSLQAAINLKLLRPREQTNTAEFSAENWRSRVIHDAGVNALAIEKHDGRLMISGGADPSIFLWDLEQKSTASPETFLSPIGNVKK